MRLSAYNSLYKLLTICGLLFIFSICDRGITLVKPCTAEFATILTCVIRQLDFE